MGKLNMAEVLPGLVRGEGCQWLFTWWPTWEQQASELLLLGILTLLNIPQPHKTGPPTVNLLRTFQI